MPSTNRPTERSVAYPQFKFTNNSESKADCERFPPKPPYPPPPSYPPRPPAPPDPPSLPESPSPLRRRRRRRRRRRILLTPFSLLALQAWGRPPFPPILSHVFPLRVYSCIYMYSASYTRNGGVYTKWENVTEEKPFPPGGVGW